MSMNRKLKVGDLFEVRVDTLVRRFFQYVADDATQLNSQVVRVFRESYDSEGPCDIQGITSGTIDFYAHVFLRLGLKQHIWRKVGHADVPENLDVLFRDTNDYGNPEIAISQNWHIWKINRPFEKVGQLPPSCERADIGVVVPPDSLVHRMRYGKYDFIYPGYSSEG